MVAISAQIAWERTGLAPLGVILHGVAIAAGFLLLFFALLVPALFVAACALMAAGTIRLAAEGSKFRSLGNFTFIPALYLACEMGENLPHDLYWPTALAFFPYIALAIIPVIIQAGIEHMRAGRAHPDGLRHLIRLTRDKSHGNRSPYLEDMAAVILAVGTAACLVEWQGLDHGQWVIWSAASVVTGDTASSRLKLRDRTTGALIGVPVGILLGFAMPHSAIAYGLASLGAILTLVAFERYVIGFGTRCALIALALLLSGQSVVIASERVLNVILGGFIGVLFVLAAHLAARRVKLPATK